MLEMEFNIQMMKRGLGMHCTRAPKGSRIILHFDVEVVLLLEGLNAVQIILPTEVCLN